MEQVLTNTQSMMQKAFEVLLSDLSTIRTGKASPTLVENIFINAYGGAQRLKVLELATIHAQDPQTLIVSPYDSSIIAEIEKGIHEANAGINPIVDGDILRISIPPLSEERRKEMVKLVNQKTESGKIMIRQARHESMEQVKKMGNSKTISEDDVTRLEKEIQKITDSFMEKIDNLRKAKEEELLKI